MLKQISTQIQMFCFLPKIRVFAMNVVALEPRVEFAPNSLSYLPFALFTQVARQLLSNLHKVSQKHFDPFVDAVEEN